MTTCTPSRTSFGVMMAVMVGTPDGSAFAGRDAALADLHRDHYRSLVRLACFLVDDVGSGEEVVQDAGRTRRGTRRAACAAPSPARVSGAPLHADLSEAEIATTLGISAGSVKSHSHRGMAALTVALQEDS